MLWNNELTNQIDNYVSKLSILSKIKLREDYNLWNEGDTKEFLKAISFGGDAIGAHQVNVFINELKIQSKMKTKKIVEKDGEQVNIAETIDKMEFNPITK